MNNTEISTVPLPLPVDFAMLHSLAEAQGEGEPDLIVELIDLYLEDTPPRFAAMREALANSDSVRLGRAAHSLKGSSATLGAVQVAASCAELELLARGVAFTEVRPVLDRLEDELILLRSTFLIEREARAELTH